MFVVSSGCLGDGDAAVHGSADSADSRSDTARSVERNHVLPEPRLAETKGYYRKDSLLLSIYVNIANYKQWFHTPRTLRIERRKQKH